MSSGVEDPHLKEILYVLLEKVRTTKAALYLADANLGFRLASQYGFGRADKLPERLQRTDVLVTFIFERREPWYANDPRSAGKLSDYMEAEACARLLTAPLYVDGRIVGILLARDKAGMEPFGPEDIPWVQEILRRLAVQVRSTTPVIDGDGPVPSSPFERTDGMESMLASRPLSVPPRGSSGERVDSSPATPGPASPASGTPRFVLAPRAPSGSSQSDFLPSLTERTLQLVRDRLAGTSAGKAGASSTGPSPREIGFYRLNLETLLHLPDVEAAAISVVEPDAARSWLACRRPVSDDARESLLENVERIFARAEAHFPFPGAPVVETLGTAPREEKAPLRRSEVVAIQSSVMTVASDEISVLSLLFRAGPGAESRDDLKNIHVLVKNSLSEIRLSVRYREAYRGLVNKLVEPGLRKFTALRTHSFNVGRLARKFAQSLKLSTVETEQLTVAAILHDVGMRELNYEQVYSKRTLTEAEMRLVREHPVVGGFVVGEIPWPYPVGPLVRHHHERWDGAGYPEGLAGESIPFGSRVIHLCEAFDAMTSQASYRAVLASPQALEIISSKAGTQFDPRLAAPFRSMVESLRP